MRLVRQYVATVTCGLFAAISPTNAVAEVVVIVAHDSPISSMTRDQLADLFLGKVSGLPGIGTITPVDQEEGAAVREQFYKKAASKNSAQLNAYWSRRIFTGKGEPPIAAGNTSAVKRAVASNPYVIGYIPESALDGTVRPVLVLR
jgi:ABC-type phosphate transport system substrate-binding protein